MSPGSRWRVRLGGDESDIERLSRVAIDRLTIDRHNELGWGIEAAVLETLTEPREIRAEAARLIRILRGIGRLRLAIYGPIDVGGVNRFNDQGGVDGIAFADVARGRIDALSPAGPELARKDMELARDGRRPDWALSFFGQEPTWKGLYNVLDVIGEDLHEQSRRPGTRWKQRWLHEEIERLGWATKDELDRFTGTAVSVHAVGLEEARHGKDIPAPDKPMSLTSAETLIATVLDAWLGQLHASGLGT